MIITALQEDADIYLRLFVGIFAFDHHHPVLLPLSIVSSVL